MDGNVRRFDHEGLRQLQLVTKTFAVETSYITIHLNCYAIAQQVPRPLTPCYVIAPQCPPSVSRCSMNLYHIVMLHGSYLTYVDIAALSLDSDMMLCQL